MPLCLISFTVTTGEATLPTYDYKCECGEEIEKTCSMADRKDKVKCSKCGKMAPRKWGGTFPNVICRYSLFERSAGNPRVNRGKGR